MKLTAKIVRVSAIRPDETIIAQAVKIVRQGGVIVFPTSGLYGLGADALDDQAVEKVFTIKNRESGKPLLALIDQFPMINRLVLSVSRMARYLMEAFWPGKVTFVVPARDDLPSGLTDGSLKIGVRLVAHPVAAAVIQTLGRPLTGTSANISGMQSCASIDQLPSAVLDTVDLVLDAGALAGGPGSTVVDVTGAKPVILREGAVPTDQIMAAFHRFAAAHIDNRE